MQRGRRRRGAATAAETASVTRLSEQLPPWALGRRAEDPLGGAAVALEQPQVLAPTFAADRSRDRVHRDLHRHRHRLREHALAASADALGPPPCAAALGRRRRRGGGRASREAQRALHARARRQHRPERRLRARARLNRLLRAAAQPGERRRCALLGGGGGGGGERPHLGRSKQHAQYAQRAARRDRRLVAALERVDDAAARARQQRQPRRDRREALHAQLHAAHLVAARSVEAGRDHHELGRKLAADRQHERVEGGEVLGVAHPLVRPRHVERVPGAGAAAHLARRAGAREEALAEPMQRHKQHRRVVVEDLLRAVAVVDVPVDDEHAPHAVLPHRCARRHRHRVEEAEAAHPVGARVVARWPHDGKAGAHPTGAHGLGEREHAAGGAPRGARRRLVEVHVVAAHQPPSAGQRPVVVRADPRATLVGQLVLERVQRVPVLARVARERLVARRIARRHTLALLLEL